MQTFAQQIKGPLWRKLKIIYDKYTGGADIISIEKLEALVKEVLLQQSPGQIDYIIKNVDRIDTDNSGTIEFSQFGNFILKRHCGEMSLQRMHRNGQIKNSGQHKITQSQFKHLLNLAYAFLEIRVDDSVIPEIFDSIDHDKDGLITYPEYFGFTDLYVLETRPLEQRKKEFETIKIGKPPLPHESVREFRSRFRNFLFSELQRIFTQYDKDFNNLLDNQELRLLLAEIFGLASNQITDVSGKYFKPDTQGRYQSFNTFVSNFLNYASEIGWFGLSKILPKGKSNLNAEQFIRLLQLTLNKLNLGRVDKQLLTKFFQKLDTNRDGLISITEFKTWVTEFLASKSYTGGVGTQYYIQQDDESLSHGARLIKQFSLQQQHHYPSIRIQMSPARSINQMERSLTPRIVQHELKFQTREARKPSSSSRISESQYSIRSERSRRSSRQLAIKFQFSSQDLAKRVRKQMMYLLQKLDKNRNKQFEQPEIIAALQILMKSDKSQILYVISNVFRYDRNDDNIVTYEQLANFFLEMHCGELAIQRLHKQDTYQRGSQRMMNCKQFIRTVGYALSFIQIQPYEGELQTLFNQVDLNKDGWISYQQYFEFLIHYFGTQSAVAQGERRSKRKTVYAVSFNQQTPPEQRFSKLIRSQTRVLVIAYDKNQNLRIERDEAMMIADEIFDQSEEEARVMIDAVYTKGQQSFQYDYIVNKFLELHGSETILIRLLKQNLLKHGEKRMLDVDDFTLLINTAFKYLPVLPTKQHYMDVFDKISNYSRDMITFREYQHFIAKYLGKCDSRSFNTAFDKIKLDSVKRPVNLKNNKDKLLIEGLSRSFKQHYDQIDSSNEGLDKNSVEQFVVSVFGKDNKKHLDYLLWTVFRMDQDLDGKVKYEQAIPFIFRTKAELELNDLHRQNPEIENKQRLSAIQFNNLIKKSFEFYDFKKQLNGTFERIDTDRDGFISDRQYLTWILGITRSL